MKSRLVKYRSALLILTTLCIIQNGSLASAETMTVDRPQAISGHITIPRFDPRLGTLESVDLTTTMLSESFNSGGSSGSLYQQGRLTGFEITEVTGITGGFTSSLSSGAPSRTANLRGYSSDLGQLVFNQSFSVGVGGSAEALTLLNQWRPQSTSPTSPVDIQLVTDITVASFSHSYSARTQTTSIAQVDQLYGDDDLLVPTNDVEVDASWSRSFSSGNRGVWYRRRNVISSQLATVNFSAGNSARLSYSASVTPRFTTSTTFTYTPSLNRYLANGLTDATWGSDADWLGGSAPMLENDVIIEGPQNLVVTNATGAANSLYINPSPGRTISLELDGALEVPTTTTLTGRSILTGDGVLLGGRFAGGAESLVDASSGSIQIGEADLSNAFATEGAIRVGANSLMTILTGTAAKLGSSTEISGGLMEVRSLNGPGIAAIGNGDLLAGYGEVDARIAASLGSTLAVNGTQGGVLTLGATNARDGFVSNGVLTIGDGTVGKQAILNDADAAVLGNLTRLIGDGTRAILTAGAADSSETTPHLLLQQGRAVEGAGNIQGNFKNNGIVAGDGTALDERIVFESPWIVSGTGTFENTLVEGTFAPGNSPGIVEGNSLAFAGAVEIELGGLVPGDGPNNHDQIVDGGTLEILDDVTLKVLPWNGFAPELGDQFEIIRAEEISGQFAAIDTSALSLPSQTLMQVSYAADSVMLAVVEALSGDFNADGSVDGSDFLSWQSGSGVGTLSDWEANYGQSVNSLAASQNVPEPHGCLLGLVAMAGFASAKRRRAP